MDASEERVEHYNKLQSARKREMEYMDSLTDCLFHSRDSVTAKAQVNLIQDQLKVIENLENDMRVAYSAIGRHIRCSYFSQDAVRRVEWQKMLIKLNQIATPEKPQVDAAQNVAEEPDAMRKTLSDLNEKMDVCMAFVMKEHQEVAEIVHAIDDPRIAEILDFLQKLSAEQEAIKIALEEMNEKVSTLKGKQQLNGDGTDELDECLGQIMDLLKEVAVRNARKKAGDLATERFKSRSEVKMKKMVEEFQEKFSVVDFEDIEQLTDNEDAEVID